MKFIISLLAAIMLTSCTSYTRTTRDAAPRFDPTRAYVDDDIDRTEALSYNAELHRLLNYTNTSLWALPYDDVESIRNTAERVRPTALAPAFIGVMRWTNALEYIVYVEGDPQYQVPDAAKVRTVVMSTNYPGYGGFPQEFSVGWRKQIVGFEIIRNDPPDDLGDFLVCTVRPSLGSTNLVSREYYAFVPCSMTTDIPSLALIRLQSPDGTPFVTQYGYFIDHLTIGPVPHFYNVSFPDIFARSSTAEVLSALLFISSYHSYPPYDGNKTTPQEWIDHIPVELVETKEFEDLQDRLNPWIDDYQMMIREKAQQSMPRHQSPPE